MYACARVCFVLVHEVGSCSSSKDFFPQRGGMPMNRSAARTVPHASKTAFRYERVAFPRFYRFRRLASFLAPPRGLGLPVG